MVTMLAGVVSASPANAAKRSSSNGPPGPYQLAYQGFRLTSGAFLTPPTSQFIINEDGSDLQQIGKSNNPPPSTSGLGTGDSEEGTVSWSKSGSRLAFFNDACAPGPSGPPTGTGLCSIEVESVRTKKDNKVEGTPISLTSTEIGNCIRGGAVDLTWSPDSSQIAYSENSESCPQHFIQLVSAADGESVGTVPNSFGSYAPTWSSATNRIAFIVPNPNGANSTAPNTITVETLVESAGFPVKAQNVTPLNPFMGISPNAISFSPDGTQLAVEGDAFIPSGAMGAVSIIDYIYVENADGTNPHLLWTGVNIGTAGMSQFTSNSSCSLGDEAWSPDGNTIACGYSLSTDHFAGDCSDINVTRGIQELNATSGAVGALLDKTVEGGPPGVVGPFACNYSSHWDGAPAWRTPDTYVALGDSFSTGYGMPHQVTGISGCGTYSSTESFPVLFDPGAAVAACKASTSETEEIQVPTLTAATTVVSLTVGGDNDFGISPTFCSTSLSILFCDLLQCFVPRAPWDNVPCTSQFHIDPTAIQPSLGMLLQSIHARAPKAKIYVMGYPNPFPQTLSIKRPGRYDNCPDLSIRWLGVPQTDEQIDAGLANEDIAWGYNLITGINNVLSNAVQGLGAPFYYVPPSYAVGHDVCQTGKANWWLGRLVHPNKDGNQAMANALRLKVEEVAAGGS